MPNTMDEQAIIAIEPIIQTFQKVHPYLTTLSPVSYNYYKDAKMPLGLLPAKIHFDGVAQTLEHMER